jgi:hypothetical protein
MHEHEQVTKIIQRLRQIQQKPGMYIGSDPLGIVPFLHGFAMACDTLGLSQHSRSKDRVDALREIMIRRGWEWSTRHIAFQMQDQGYSYSEIAQETLDIEIELWRELYNLT